MTERGGSGIQIQQQLTHCRCWKKLGSPPLSNDPKKSDGEITKTRFDARLVVDQSNKDRAAGLASRACSEKYATESQTEHLKLAKKNKSFCLTQLGNLKPWNAIL